MGLNGLSGKSIARISRATGLTNIVRATVTSHRQHWYVWLTLTPHQHAVYDKRDGELEMMPPGASGWCTSLCRTLFPEGSGPAPSLIDSVPQAPGEPGGHHIRETTEDGYPLMGSSPAERAASEIDLARIKAQAMRDHPFVGDGPYCEAWIGGRPMGSPDTGTVTMRVGCGYPRDTHPRG